VAVALSLANAKLSFGSSQLGACNYAAIFRQLCVHVSGLSQRVACLLLYRGRAPRQTNPTAHESAAYHLSSAPAEGR
jgi:hypothetical protein